MQPQISSQFNSFHSSDSPMVFNQIFSESISVAQWQREENKVIKAYFQSVSDSLRLGIRNVFNVSSLQASLNDLLPDGIGKEQAINDIYLLTDMLTCLFDCKEVGLRLTTLNKAMCPRFHVDNIPLRLVTTYLGPGTEWLPNEAADAGKLGHAANGKADNTSGLYAEEQSIRQLDCFDVALLKGSAWGQQHNAAIHRSCELSQFQQRVLLTLDPI